MMGLCELLGIDLPIIQAPMAGAQGSALAVAVSNAGGLGSLPCGLLSPEQIRSELDIIRAQTRAPVNVNFFCHQPPVVNTTRAAAWRDSLNGYYREFGIDPAQLPAPGGRAAFDRVSAELLREFRPAVVSFHFGLPEPELIGIVRSWGARVIGCATTVAEAHWLEERGVDVIIAQGLEAGGHRGLFLSADLHCQLGSLALWPQVARAVQVPVVAAGGIADAAGVRAAFALGAAGVQVGTAYLLCPEAHPSAVHRAALQSLRANETALTNVHTGRPARGIVNRLMREHGPISALAPEFPLAAAAVAPLRAHAEAHGSGDFSPLWAGQNVSGCRALPAAELTRALMPPGAAFA